MSKIRLRFAPSPTGFLHIGGLRTALFNYLIAKNLNGKFILRIEDTDKKRQVAGAVESLIDILDWVGVEFDEGARAGGKHGPYIQSQRFSIYKKHIDELLEKGGAYHCFCAPERLQRMREDRQAEKLPPRYDRACRDLSEEEIKKRIKEGDKFVIRQKMPDKGEVVAYDELRGEVKFKADELDDHILIKSNGIPTYQFASVVDDHLMEISHILRGEEWLPSFPKNILLYKSFGWQPPKFIHIPLILSKGGGKLSKRQGDVAVDDFRSQGYLAESLINFCALLGWHLPETAGDKSEIFTLKELEKIFQIKDIGLSPAVFDIEKLNYLNGYYIRQKPLDELAGLCLPFLEKYWEEKGSEIFAKALRTSDEYIQNVVRLERERMKKLSEIGELTEFFFKDELEYAPDLLIWKKMTNDEVKNNLEVIYKLLEKIPEENWTNDSIKEAIMSYIQAKELKVGEHLWPMRTALTGRRASPDPFDVAEVLGKERSLGRIDESISKS